MPLSCGQMLEHMDLVDRAGYRRADRCADGRVAWLGCGSGAAEGEIGL